MLTDFASLENTCLRERFSVFSAYYLPGVSPETIPDDITSVNLLRIVLNAYFGTDFLMLENAHYYFRDSVYIFRVEDVISRVDTCTPLSSPAH